MLCGLLGVVAAAAGHPKAPPPLLFSAGFTSDMVLQRGARNAIYGTLNATAATAGVTLTLAGPAQQTVEAQLRMTPEGLYEWRAELSPVSSAAEWSLTAECRSCPNASASLDRVVFGDVWFCSGQSNMQLPIHYTYSAIHLTQEVLAGKYSNIRFFSYPTIRASTPSYVTQEGATKSWYNVTYAAGLPEPLADDEVGGVHLNPFHVFSATCMYFGVEVTDAMGTDAPHIGLIQSAVGGTQIEQWLDNDTLPLCSNISQTPSVWGTLYYGMVTPFVNRTVTGWLWYQGENNCHNDPGNSADGEGYGCEMMHLPMLWRERWEGSGAAVKDAPFGVVTLAAGGSEGAGYNMAGIRWSQTANYGKLPNPVMPNVFGAQAYDLGDPWASQCRGCNCSSPNKATGKYDPDCAPWDPSSWNPGVRPLAPYIRNGSTPVFMGPIHPRLKREVGRRLAAAYLNGYSTGPTLAGCRMDSAGTEIELIFDKDALRGETVVVRPFDSNISNWGTRDSNSLMVCTGSAVDCACHTWNYVRVPNPKDPNSTGHDIAKWFCIAPKGPQPTAEERQLSEDRDALHELESSGLQWVPTANPALSGWAPAPIRAGSSGTAAVVDLSGVNVSAGVYAVRYGWPFNSDTCCPFTDVQKGLASCPPGSCPLFSSSSWLPANPFFATFAAGATKCSCPHPEDCSA